MVLKSKWDRESTKKNIEHFSTEEAEMSETNELTQNYAFIVLDTIANLLFSR